VKLKPVNYRMIRDRVTPRSVLEHFGWRAVESTARSCRGPCPFHGSRGKGSRIFSCTLTVAYCHKCKWTGDATALWAGFTAQPMLEAAHNVCHFAGIAVPTLQ